LRLGCGSAIFHVLGQFLQLLCGSAQSHRPIAPDVWDHLIVDVGNYAMQFLFDTSCGVSGILLPRI
jgi:hypothetical protein